jgi:cystathionine beta-lyase/cystathionine gamma-synthase
VTPIFQSATFLMQSGERVKYTRCNNNPSQIAVANKLAALEGAEDALVLSSGMAAISSTLLALLKAGDHLLIQVQLACD